MPRAGLVWTSMVLVLGVMGESNHIPGSSRSISSGDELVATVIDSCFDGDDSVTTCIKKNALSYLDHLTGPTRDSRTFDEEKHLESEEGLDDLILDRTRRFLNTHQFKVQLPEFLFQEAVLTFQPSKGLDFDVSFPPTVDGEGRAYSEARDMMKQKMLLPLLLLLKLKLKALTPLLVAIVGMKALKALILSKISILLVIGFLASQLLKKAGMKDMMPSMMMEPTPYGPPAPPAPPMTGYGAPAAPAPPVTMSSYEPSWEPSPGGPYKRTWEPQQVVYNAYQPSTQNSAAPV
ncbi:uncharacterized protein LOC128982872 isoform X2 [Macrosteles quadrilineatus]|uniref:uncharacterized protein LOC128982872 isoform X2 n=1 Tax=Macrosteles quadrilineatus TaxID=74068 RepID=UPI0023E22BC8|nr:uncharacterized protein LOC128982872 isoform X2 [Macrosteles quadrilineatus]